MTEVRSSTNDSLGKSVLIRPHQEIEEHAGAQSISNEPAAHDHSNPSFFELESAKFLSSIQAERSSAVFPQLLVVGGIVAAVVVVVRRRQKQGKELHEKSLA